MTAGMQERDFIHRILEDIRKSIPIDDDRLLISKVYHVLRKLVNNPYREESWKEAESYVNECMDRALSAINNFEQMEVPGPAENIHLKLIYAFSVYYDGLCRWKEFLAGRDTNQILDTLGLVFKADQLMLDAENNIGEFFEENPVSTLL